MKNVIKFWRFFLPLTHFDSWYLFIQNFLHPRPHPPQPALNLYSPIQNIFSWQIFGVLPLQWPVYKWQKNLTLFEAVDFEIIVEKVWFGKFLYWFVLDRRFGHTTFGNRFDSQTQCIICATVRRRKARPAPAYQEKSESLVCEAFRLLLVGNWLSHTSSSMIVLGKQVGEVWKIPRIPPRASPSEEYLEFPYYFQ